MAPRLVLDKEFSDALHVYRHITPAHRGNPTPALMEAMHKLADREIKAGRMLDSGGLMPVAMGAQVQIADGKLSVIDGPFVEAKETDRRLRDLRTARQGRGHRGGRSSSCSCTRITCRAGRGRARLRAFAGP